MTHREKISRFAKARLIEAYQIDEDFLEIAKLLKIKRETAYTIIARKDNDMGQHEFINITDERLARQSLADYRFRLIGEIRESSKGSITGETRQSSRDSSLASSGATAAVTPDILQQMSQLYHL